MLKSENNAEIFKKLLMTSWKYGGEHGDKFFWKRYFEGY